MYTGENRPITAKESRNRNSEASCPCYYLKMVVINNSRIELNDQKFENLALFSEKIFVQRLMNGDEAEGLY
jgi:hypothetical protein